MTDELELEYWLQYAAADLESSEVLLNNTDNYHISIYHSHQAIEKMLKRYCMKMGKEFPFVHDLLAIVLILKEYVKVDEQVLKDFNFMMKVYSSTRYPKGESLSKEEASKALAISKKYFDRLK